MPRNLDLSKIVLLVEDLDILREMIRDFLESLGIEVPVPCQLRKLDRRLVPRSHNLGNNLGRATKSFVERGSALASLTAGAKSSYRRPVRV